MKHKHHIIPKHEGGIDQPENIIYLSIEEHAEAHRLLYEKNGKIEDYLAWKGLAGIMSKEEIVQKLMSENGKAVGNKMFQDKKGIFNEDVKRSEKYKSGISKGGKKAGKIHAESGHCKAIAPLGGGKNLDKTYWYNESTGQETVSFERPGEGWSQGIDMKRVNVDFLRTNSYNVKGSFWIKNEDTRETKMVKNEDEIPTGFKKGRIVETKNVIDLHNTSESFKIRGIPQVRIEYSYIIFNPQSLRWELIPKKNSKRIIKISHTDYYGLIWIRDILIEKYSLKDKKSGFELYLDFSIDEAIQILKNWREYIKIQKILKLKKLRKWRKDDYGKKLALLEESFSFIESIRNKVIPVL